MSDEKTRKIPCKDCEDPPHPYKVYHRECVKSGKASCNILSGKKLSIEQNSCKEVHTFFVDEALHEDVKAIQVIADVLDRFIPFKHNLVSPDQARVKERLMELRHERIIILEYLLAGTKGMDFK